MKADYESVVAKYLELRHKCEEIDREAKDKIAELKRQMLVLETWLTNKAKEEGLNSIPTKAGTAYWSTHYSCTVANPTMFFDFVRAHEAWDLLEKRASKTAVKSYIDEEGIAPPGVNFSSYQVLVVRENRVKE